MSEKLTPKQKMENLKERIEAEKGKPPKQCNVCGQWRSLKNFYYREGEGYRQPCRFCYPSRMKKYQETMRLKRIERLKQAKEKAKENLVYRQARNRLKERAQKQEVDCLSTAEYREWSEGEEGQATRCYYCGFEFETIEDNENARKRLAISTIDRLEPYLGYLPDNMVRSCARCNMIKGNWFTSGEMEGIASDYNLAKRAR